MPGLARRIGRAPLVLGLVLGGSCVETKTSLTRDADRPNSDVTVIDATRDHFHHFSTAARPMACRSMGPISVKVDGDYFADSRHSIHDDRFIRPVQELYGDTALWLRGKSRRSAFESMWGSDDGEIHFFGMALECRPRAAPPPPLAEDTIQKQDSENRPRKKLRVAMRVAKTATSFFSEDGIVPLNLVALAESQHKSMFSEAASPDQEADYLIHLHYVHVILSVSEQHTQSIGPAGSISLTKAKSPQVLYLVEVTNRAGHLTCTLAGLTLGDEFALPEEDDHPRIDISRPTLRGLSRMFQTVFGQCISPHVKPEPPAAPKPEAKSSSDPGLHRVKLWDGSALCGVLVKREHPKSIVLRIPSGELRSIDWTEFVTSSLQPVDKCESDAP